MSASNEARPMKARRTGPALHGGAVAARTAAGVLEVLAGADVLNSTTCGVSAGGLTLQRWPQPAQRTVRPRAPSASGSTWYRVAHCGQVRIMAR